MIQWEKVRSRIKVREMDNLKGPLGIFTNSKNNWCGDGVGFMKVVSNDLAIGRKLMEYDYYCVFGL